MCKELRRIKMGKAPGTDAEVWRRVRVPDNWKVGIIVTFIQGERR